MTKAAGHPGPIMRDPSNLPESTTEAKTHAHGKQREAHGKKVRAHAAVDAQEDPGKEEQDSALAVDSYAPSEHELAGGASLAFSVWLMLLAGLGIFASQALYRDELVYRPGLAGGLSCDLNSVVKCSSSIGSWQAHLFFGVSNALLGLIAFSGLFFIGLYLAFRGKLAKWIWWAFAVITLVAMGLVIWFMEQSINFFGTLCPYCMLTWVVTLALFVTFWSRQIRVTKGLYRRLRPLVVTRWGIGLLLFVIGALWLIIGLWSEIVKLF